ncbi:hypothetical protein Glove_345g18 [Diversispora epigaea]|uniref:Uncharacterized protein n=1 Tax=Diversispora epigaea TaxID=1348612 RepID=A0A397HKE3_9GLOM|nr:hypothetical protein Glove_345g18 [Diversispora epigaea]
MTHSRYLIKKWKYRLNLFPNPFYDDLYGKDSTEDLIIVIIRILTNFFPTKNLFKWHSDLRTCLCLIEI